MLPVHRVPPLWPLIEVNDSLEEGEEAEHKAVQLDQAPVPSKGLI